MAKPRFRDGVPAAWLLTLAAFILVPLTAGALSWLGILLADATDIRWLRGLPVGIGFAMIITVIRRVIR